MSNLQSGSVKSCGCLHLEINRTILRTLNITHDKTNTKLYQVWSSMKQRCYHGNNKNYKHYGGRGIIMCDEWLNDFMNFYNWSMDNGYDDTLTIDRIDVNGNYEPSNCRWATMKQQNRNQRRTIYFTYNNETHCLKEWCADKALELNERGYAI